MTSTGNLSSPENNIYQINDHGIEFKESGGYAALTIRRADLAQKAEEKDNLELQKLRSDVILITNQLVDYKKVKSNANCAIIIAAISALATIAQAIVQALSK
jgi:hypothetical protein